MEREKIFISSPLEAEHVARIRALAPDRVEVMYEPELLPPTRYRNDHKGAPFTRNADQAARWDAMLREATISFDIPSAEDLKKAAKLRWIQATSTGVGQHIARIGLQESDILVTTARGVHARPLAEFVFAALLAHFRGLAHLQAEQRAHRWTRYCADEVGGKTLVIIGAGDLARGSAKVAKGLEMHVVAVARDPAKARTHNDLFDEVLPSSALHEALSRADAVVVTVPHTPETERMIDAAAIAAMRPGAAFVNIARGQVVEEPALIAALQSGHIGFAALDVAEVEPLPSESPLWDMPNVLISPHSASTVDSENARITDIFLHNLRCWLDGRRQEMINVLDKRLMY
ncbi:D-2-hydroxyacid dehydrogenase [Roseomonas sp. AR75]|jgi:phosphoglycerate dehydrogenase-like enzyme|uniref:D-2-hydroxyacid dehydrogenase n=1 Tax=Roseomonas sp. AR75 TaxID=2562311 RepID=UPI0014853ABF|nr:D-2-hydroxyacid dehydrogenase [Roseomonas sp. AR75]